MFLFCINAVVFAMNDLYPLCEIKWEIWSHNAHLPSHTIAKQNYFLYETLHDAPETILFHFVMNNVHDNSFCSSGVN